MNIIIHTHEFNLKGGGPCTKRMDSFANTFVSNNHNVTIITGSHNKKNELKNINKKYKIIYSPTIGTGKKKYIYRFIEQSSFAITSFFVGLFRLKKSDILITTSPPLLSSITGYLIGKIKHAKVIYDIRDIWPDVALEMGSFNKKSVYFKVFNFIAKFMYKRSDFISTVSPSKVKKLEKYSNNEKVWYIPNGLDDNFINFKIDKSLVKKYNLNKKFTVIYTGNVGLSQNLDAMIELAKFSKDDKNIQFLIFGDGAYKKTLEANIKNAKLKNISIEEKIDYEKVYTLLKYSKISFVSLKNNNMTDSIPTKMFDALGIGCPILLLASGDSVDILKESKLGESAKSIEELKEKFLYMLNNYEQYEKLKDKAIKYTLDNYSRNKIAKKLLNKMNKF